MTIPEELRRLADVLGRYSYDVTADTAPLAAAADIAAVAMERAIEAAAVARPGVALSQYTKKQLAIIERFRAEMAAAGGLLPSHWQNSSSREIAEAGIKALRDAAIEQEWKKC